MASNPQDAPQGQAAPARQSLAPLAMDDRGIYIVTNQADEQRVAKMLMQSGAVNQSLKNETQVLTAMQAAKSVGLNPYTALRQIGFINGSLTFYGDLELAMVRMSGLLYRKEEFLYCREDEPLRDDEGKLLHNKDGKPIIRTINRKRCFENNNTHLPADGAVCRMWRKGFEGEGPEETSFSVEDAKAAGLWQKTPTWRNFPGRMMQMRARGLCIRNGFSDVTQGIATQEYDMEGIDYGRGKPVHSHINEELNSEFGSK